MNRRHGVLMIVLFAVPLACSAVEWITPATRDAKPIWGIKDGMVFALWPASLEGEGAGGPRGLIRVGYERDRTTRLINFIALEPVNKKGEKGFSELEWSDADKRRGKRMWASSSQSSYEPSPRPPTEQITRPVNEDTTIEELLVFIHVETFRNGCHPYLTVSIRSDRPEELLLTVYHKPDSAKMRYCILTATMGNYERLRLLWLKDEIIYSKRLYDGYQGNDFVEKEPYPLKKLFVTSSGEVIVAATTDEDDPRSVQAAPPRLRWWNYRADKVTQYWRKHRGEYRADLHVRVNGRACYWASNLPIPNGISFENFEMREQYYPGQTFVFGITRRTPQELGFPAVKPNSKSSRK